MVDPAPVLHVMCGLPGSGKTTRARELEAAGCGVLLNGDRWIRHVFADDAEQAARDERRGRIEALQWQVAEQLLVAGVSVILDWGVWARDERDDLRARAAAVGAECRIVFTDAPLPVLHERVAARNRALSSDSFHITPEELDEWAESFEPPETDELDP